MAATVLANFAATPATELPRVGLDGLRPINSIYDKSVATGLFTDTAQDDVQRLYCLFDAALAHGLSSFILDYVNEVAADPLCTSSDPLESTLLDGRCIKQWCHQALQDLQEGAREDQGSQGSDIPQAAAAADTLVLVAETLAQGRAKDADFVQAKQLQQLFQVQEWAARQKLAAREGLGRFASLQQWQTALRQRRSSSPGGVCLLDELLASLQDLGCDPISYPPAHASAALSGIFGSGNTGQAALHCKLELLLYYALDCGLPLPGEALWHGFGIRPAVYAHWKMRFLLDDAASGLPSSVVSLDEACRTLPGCASHGTPFTFIAALARLGRPHAALASLQARAGPARGSSDASSSTLQGLSLQEAQAALRIRLDCGDVTEAFFELRRHCSCMADLQEQRQACSMLTRTLVEWASAHAALDAVLQLPLNAMEVQVLEQTAKR